MGAISRRLQKLLDERDALETGRLAIAQGLPVPSIAQQYVPTASGTGEKQSADALRLWFDERLKEIDRQIRKFPFVLFRRSSSIVQVTGRDLSQFNTNTTT